jgi:hypothetical protein
MGRSGVVCSLWYGASKCNGNLTMDTFSVAPWVTTYSGSYCHLFRWQGYNLGALIENVCKWWQGFEGSSGLGNLLLLGQTATWASVLRGASLGHRSYAKVGRWKTTIGCLSWHMLLCGEDAHMISIRMLWVKCTTSAECKSIRIAESSDMDDWNGCCLAQCQFWFTKCFLKNGEWC